MTGFLPVGWLPVVQLLGAAQGLFLAAVLASSRANRTANRLLAAVMAGFSLDLAMAWVYATGFDRGAPHLVGVDFLTPFLYGPLMYCYARSVELGGKRLPDRAWLHFLPFLAVAAALVPFYLQPSAAKLALRADPGASAWTPWLNGLNQVKLAYALVYIVAALRVARRQREAVRLRFASDRHATLGWLLHMLVGGALLWLVSTVVYIAGRALGSNDPLAGFSDVVSILLAAYVYAIGWLGLRQHELPAVPEEPLRAPRYDRSGLTADRVRELADALDRLMREERAYREPDLGLAPLAERLGVPTHHLSEALNSGHGRSFYEYVNGWRVEEVKRRLAEPATDHLTVLALAEDAGFASKSAFHTAFRRETGQTPTEYRAAVRKGRG